MSMQEQPALAVFEVGGQERARARFNPATLKVTATNQIGDSQGTAFQASAKTATKLDVELVFDTTETGEDVQADVGRVRELALVRTAASPLEPVTFRWGSFTFTGAIESIGATFEFFSSAGTPLRAMLSIAMKGLRVEEPPGSAGGAPGTAAPAIAASGPRGAAGATDVARSAGDPRAGRLVAAANGLESMRAPGIGTLRMPSGPALLGPAGATAGPRAAASAAFTGLRGASAPLRIGPLTVPTPPDPPAPSAGARFDLSGRLLGAATGISGRI